MERKGAIENEIYTLYVSVKQVIFLNILLKVRRRDGVTHRANLLVTQQPSLNRLQEYS